MKLVPLCVSICVCLTLCGFLPSASAATLQVGPGKPFATPCAAIAAAAAGDTIQIDSATYTGDVCQWSTNNLTIIGVGTGRAVLNAGGHSSQGKAIWVISGKNTVVENIEFTGAAVPDNNGAGIRQEGDNLTVRNCYFHDNQEGILTDPGQNSTILIEFSEFARNGAGDGFSHNLYIGNVGHLIFRYNYSHSAFVGHLFKSRAAQNDILYNRFSDEADGTASYEIDIPNGGKSLIIGNLIEQGPKTQNSTIIAYQEEGPNAGNPDHELFVINNTVVNDFPGGTFVLVNGSVTAAAVIKNNIFVGPGTISSQSTAVQSTNFAGNAQLVNQAGYDYRLLPSSPAIDLGTDPGSAGGVSLAPIYQYVHPACAEGRNTTGKAIDVGAYEFGGGTGVAPANAPSRCAPHSSAPAVTLSPTTLSFASQPLSQASPGKPVTLTNYGNAPLTISSITISGANSGDFAQTNSCGASLSSGASCTITVTFTPSVSGNRAAALAISDDANGSPHSVQLSGSGAAPAPVVSLVPASLSFAAQSLGTASAPQPIKLTNSGNAALTISNISAAGDFAETNNCPATLAPSANCSINVTFTPAAGGTRVGAVPVFDNASGTPQKVSLTGTGAGSPPAVSLSPASMVFPGQLLGTASGAQTATLKNIGAGPLAINRISSAGDFSESTTCPASLAANASCNIAVVFKPVSGGALTGLLTVEDNAGNSPQSLSLSGSGMDFALSVTPSSTAVTAGATATFVLALSPDGGFSQAVNFTCSGAPAGSSCTLTPSSLTPGSSTASSASVTVSTAARSFFLPTAWMLLFLAATMMAYIFRSGMGRARRPARIVVPIFGVSVILLVAVCSGCVGLSASKTLPGQGSGTPAGTYNLAITATSGSLTRVSNVTLIVK